MAHPRSEHGTYADDMSEAEAAEYLGTFVTQIIQWQEARAFGRWVDSPSGRVWRVRRSELDAWLEQHAAEQHFPPRPHADDAGIV